MSVPIPPLVDRLRGAAVELGIAGPRLGRDPVAEVILNGGLVVWYPPAECGSRCAVTLRLDERKVAWLGAVPGSMMGEFGPFPDGDALAAKAIEVMRSIIASAPATSVRVAASGRTGQHGHLPPAASDTPIAQPPRRVRVTRRTHSVLLDGQAPGATWETVVASLREALADAPVNLRSTPSVFTIFAGLDGAGPPRSISLHREGRIVVPSRGGDTVTAVVADTPSPAADARIIEDAVSAVLSAAAEAGVIRRSDIPLMHWPTVWWDREAERVPLSPAAIELFARASGTPEPAPRAASHGTAPAPAGQPERAASHGEEEEPKGREEPCAPQWLLRLVDVVVAESWEQTVRRLGRVLKRRDAVRWVPPVDAPAILPRSQRGGVTADGTIVVDWLTPPNPRRDAPVRLLVALWACGLGVRVIGQVVAMPKTVVAERLREAEAQRRFCEAVDVEALVKEHGLAPICDERLDRRRLRERLLGSIGG